MPTAGSEILNYTPRPELGLGANPGIPAIAPIDNNIINQTGRDLMLLNHENNLKKWEQKNKDRDKTLQALANGQVSTGNILDKDRKETIAPLQKKADDALLKMAKNPNNKDYAMAYQKAFGELNDAVTWSQHRFLGYNELEASKRNAPLKADQERIQKSIDEQNAQPFYEGQYITPQKSLDYDWEDLRKSLLNGADASTSPTETTSVTTTQTAGKPTTVKTTTKQGAAKGTTATTPSDATQGTGTTTVKRDGKVYQVTQGKVDFPKIRQNALNEYTHESGKQFENMKLHRDALETAPDEVYEPYMNGIIKRISDYNNDLQLKPSGDNLEGNLIDHASGYIDPKVLSKQLGIDPNTGKRTGGRIMMSTPDYAAVSALASVNGSYAPKTEKYDKEATEADIKIQAEKDKVAADKGKLGLGYAKLREQVNKRMASQKTEADQNTTFDDMYTRNIMEQKNLVMVTPSGVSSQIPAESSLPVYTIKGGKVSEIKPFGQEPVYEHPEEKGKAKGKITGYTGGYYKLNYIEKASGKPISNKQILQAYNKYKQTIPDATFDDFIKESVSAANAPIDYTVQGENGSSDRKLALAAQKKVSNASQKKGQEGIFGESDDDKSDDNEPPETN